MDDNLQREIAESLEATPELLPFIPELLSDIWVLGSSPDLIADMLQPLYFRSEGARALELGCGKGAVAITLAQKLSIRVLGIDSYQPFIREAARLANEMGVGDLCKFACCNMHDVLRRARGFDVVVYAAVGGTLGGFDQCVGKLRRCVHPGGYIVIDDAFLKADKKIDSPGYEHYVPHEEIFRRITANGDVLLREEIIPVEKIRAYNRKSTELIRKRAEQLIRLHPEAAGILTQYVRRQEIESEILETDTTGAVWLLKRTDPE